MEEFRDYGMREYKAPLSLRIKNFFFTHPILVAVLVAIIISLFMGGCDKARAEEMALRDQTYLNDNYFTDCENYNDAKQYLDFVFDNFPYYQICESENGKVIAMNFYNQPDYFVGHFGNPDTSTDPEELWYYTWSFAGSTDRMVIYGRNDANIELSGLVDNRFSNNSYQTDIMDVVVYIITDASTGNPYIIMGADCAYDDAVGSRTAHVWNAVSNTELGTETGEYNTFSKGDARVTWVSSHDRYMDSPFPSNSTNTNSQRLNYFSEFTIFKTNYSSYKMSNRILTTTYITGPFAANIEYPPEVNTPGFECYKIETKGGIYFIADYSSLIAYGVTNTSTFSCDVHLDNTVQTITLDSTSEYYIYDDTYREAEYSFPITAFVPNYTDYTNVWIDNVLVVNTKSAHGAFVDSTFVYIDPIVIMGSVPTDDLEPSTIPQISPMPESLEEYGIEYHSGDELKELYNNNMFNQWITEDEFYGDIAQLGGGRSVKLVGATDQNVPANNTDNTLAYLENVAAILSGTADVPGTGAVMTVVYGVNAFFDTISAPRNNGQIDFNGAAEDYIRDNLYSSTYDIIVLEAYYDAEALQTNSNDLLYTPIPSIDDLHAGEPYTGKIFYVILTQRYIESLNLDGLGSLQRLMESDVHYVKGIYDYMYDRLNDFEDKSLDSFKGIIGVENNILDKLNNVDTFIQRIEGVLNRILDALKTLHLSQLDTIDTKMGTIIEKLNTIATRNDNEFDTVEEAISYYKQHNENGYPIASVFTENRFSLWMSGKVHDWWSSVNNTNSGNAHSSLLIDTFGVLKNAYESMTSETKFIANIRVYLLSLTDDAVEDDPDTTYVTGFFGDSFDPDSYDGFGGGAPLYE